MGRARGLSWSFPSRDLEDDPLMRAEAHAPVHALVGPLGLRRQFDLTCAWNRDLLRRIGEIEGDEDPSAVERAAVGEDVGAPVGRLVAPRPKRRLVAAESSSRRYSARSERLSLRCSSTLHTSTSSPTGSQGSPVVKPAFALRPSASMPAQDRGSGRSRAPGARSGRAPARTGPADRPIRPRWSPETTADRSGGRRPVATS